MGHEGGTAALGARRYASETLQLLQARLRQVLKPRHFSAGHGLLSVTLALPGTVARIVPQMSTGAMYWSRPAEGCLRVGSGTAFALTARGPMRFRQLAEQFAQISDNWLHVDADGTGCSPQAMLGFAFCPEESASWYGAANAELRIPSALIEGDGYYRVVTFSCARSQGLGLDGCIGRWLQQARDLLSESTRVVAEPGPRQRLAFVQSIPSDQEWFRRVDDARAMIAQGRVEKLVLTRRLRVEAARSLSPTRLLRWLERHYPNCTNFVYRAGHGTLVGASPERLVKLNSGRLMSDAVASTTVRTHDSEEDGYLEQELRANPKARHEHDLVVDAIVQALKPLCRRLDVPAEPAVMKLETLQHLWTLVEGEAKPGVSLLDCAARLHPTPAVGGMPREPALTWLAEHREQRGWYTGGLGWMTPQGDGELAVVLRCAMLDGAKAELYAGAGIVAASDPQAELAETKLKMRAMLDALGAAQDTTTIGDLTNVKRIR